MQSNLKLSIMESSLSEKESLELIGKMISSAKNNLQKGLGNVFLLWGYLVAVISLAIFIVLIAIPGDSRYYAYCLYALMALGAPLHIRLIRKMEQQQLVKTYIEKIMDFVWIAFTISIITVVAGMLISSVLALPRSVSVDPDQEFLRWFPWMFVTPFMLGFYGFALFVSGKAYQFKPLVTGGWVCWLATLVLIAAFHHPYLLMIQQLVLFISVIFGFIIPGHLLNKKERCHV